MTKQYFWFSCFFGAAVVFLSIGFLQAEENSVLWLDEAGIHQVPCGHGATQQCRSIDKNPLTLGGNVYERGFGTHAPMTFMFRLDGHAKRFTAWVGLDDETGKQGEIEVVVLGDGRELWKSGWRRGGDAPQQIDVGLTGVRELAVRVQEGKEITYDHVDFADAKIEYAGEKPVLNDQYYFQLYLDRKITIHDESGAEVSRMDETTCEWLALRAQIQAGMLDYVRETAFHPSSTILPEDRDPLDIATRRLVPLVKALKEMPNGPKLEAETAAVTTWLEKSRTIPVEQTAERKAAFAEVVKLRRQIALQNPLLDFQDLLFTKRHYNLSIQGGRGPNGDIWASHMCDQFFGFHAYPGGGLFVLKNAFSDHPTVVSILEDVVVKQGRNQGRKLDSCWGFLAPELSYDAGEILFAATDTTAGPRAAYEWTEDNTYHLFKAKWNPQTGKAFELTQLTDGAVNDIDPVYLPSGRIAFISERRGGYGRCHDRPVPTYTLHSMNADGSDIVTLSFHETNEWAPVVDRNGMLVYTRWDYVDRGANQAHHPWLTTPDGRDPRAIQGNYHVVVQTTPNVEVPNMELDIRPVPNSTKLTATAAAHHGQSYGTLILIDPTVQDDNQMSAIRRITPEKMFPEADPGLYSCHFGTCSPLAEEFYLCVYDAFAEHNGSHANNYGIYLLDAFGNKVLLYRDPEISCRDAIPIRPREKENEVPHQTLRGKPLAEGEQFTPVEESTLPQTANVGLMNVYDTRYPFPEGTKIKKLRIVQVLPKTTPYQWIPRIGYGDTKNARCILGTVPVEEDGSAYFSMPVNRAVYFQALDENGVAVQTMRSDTYVHEGEELVCQGCHEERHTATTPRTTAPLAMRRAPSKITPDLEGTNPMNYKRLIQPILDAKCVTCHAESEDPKAIDLSDDGTGHFSNSFNNLKPFCFFFNEYLWETPETFPMQFGSNASRLYTLLRSDHYGVQLTPEERYRFTTWMDTNCDFYGAYNDCPRQRQGEVVRPDKN